ncbi:MAG: MATE family efflux transporter [Firmicutes bacterium]|jgi:putative MATE family efflux protein|nr:MATE family efflux transporter [Bacillota bacterium]MDY2808862.1 MATE family efflux transporter [Oscillospiraceae bacterium]
MDGSTMDMTRGKPWRLITAFAIPVLLSQVFQQLYNTADALIVGRFLGDEALAAVSSSGTLIFLIISFFTGMSMGASVTISRYFGAGDYARVSRAIHTNVLLAILCGIVLTVFGVALTPTFLRWMGTDPDVLPEAISYFRYYFFGILAVVMYNTCKGIMNALGDSRRPLYYLILSSLVNIVLDLLFIAVFHWGVWSAAAATTISQAVSMVLCLIHLTKKGTIYQVRLRDLRLDREMLGQIFRYGLPSGVQNSVIGFANVIVQSNINSFGKLAMAAYGAYSKLEGFAFLPVTSFTMALTTYVSQNLGAGEYDRAKKGSRFGIITSLLLAELIGVLMYLFAPQLTAIFTETPEVIALGVEQARTISLFYCLLAFSHAVASVCRGAGKAFVPMTIMLVFWCVVRITYITTVMHFVHDIQYIYWAYPITWSLSSVVYLIYYHFSDWVHGFEKKSQKLQPEEA